MLIALLLSAIKILIGLKMLMVGGGGGDDDNGEKVIVWQDDNYIRQLKHLTTAQWEEAVFKFTSPLVVLVHSRNKKVLSYVSLIASYLTFAIFSCSPCLSNCYTFRTFV